MNSKYHPEMKFKIILYVLEYSESSDNYLTALGQ